MATLNIKEYLDRDEQKDLLRFLTAGSVDDGKSTLIGRLLFDSKKLYEDQLDALERDSKRMGNAGDHIDYALLLDGLKAEREQGITIDVAYRYFSTNNRKFIIADTPGHEQYTRNMITGGSTANLAIILVDARTGVITQTRRHTYLVSLLGIKHVVLAVNKMDLVDFDKNIFDKIVVGLPRNGSDRPGPQLRGFPLSGAICIASESGLPRLLRESGQRHRSQRRYGDGFAFRENIQSEKYRDIRRRAGLCIPSPVRHHHAGRRDRCFTR